MSAAKAGEDLRHLRGDELAKHMVHLNGHQKPLKFIIFEPWWAAMIVLPLPFLKLVGFLQGMVLLGVIGLLFEIVLWVVYAIRHQNIKAYPGLVNWWMHFTRRSFMPHGRAGSRHCQP